MSKSRSKISGSKPWNWYAVSRTVRQGPCRPPFKSMCTHLVATLFVGDYSDMSSLAPHCGWP
eukprot:1825588-Karenia_brevis.AAC.1